MGLPQSDAHYFYPEEAVWLMECAMGSVVHNGIALSVQQGYRLLESHGITWPQYAVYCYLKCAGYVVLPYKPRYWPRFDAIAKNSSNWVIYRAERAKLLNKNKTVSAPPASPFPNHFNNDAQLKPFLPSSSASLWNANALGIDLDYSVYAGDGSYKHTLAVTPLFLILVVNNWEEC
ncbi:unnamed protein product [Anisakis simplex]|uniref:tRNA_int_endo domain-containing protein n=1 Tax=Anisakis simplex TaxID=6269 RepID=A0A0M3JSB4_ANISI|nr:unnamed protein product [Anisakis simplex]